MNVTTIYALNLWLYRNSLADFAGCLREAPYRIVIYVSRITGPVDDWVVIDGLSIFATNE
jgi:hypothetical protein